MEHQRKNRNRNALETLKEKPLNLLHPYQRSITHLTNFIRRNEHEMNKQIISTDSSDQEVKFYMLKESPLIEEQIQFADGDKHFQSNSVRFQQTKFIDEQRSKNIIRPTVCRPSLNHLFNRSDKYERIKTTKTHFTLSTDNQSVSRPRPNTSWRKLRTNMTESYYHRIQEFQRDRQRTSTTDRIMMSPLIQPTQSLSSEDRQIDDENIISNTHRQTVSNRSEKDSSTSSLESLEEFQTISPFLSSIDVPNLLSRHVRSSDLPMMLNDRSQTKEFLVVQPSTKIEELCLLIRKLLEDDRMIEEQTTSLQQNLVKQLGILLTYFVVMDQQKTSSTFISKQTIEQSTSIDVDILSDEKHRLTTAETQTDFDENFTRSNPSLSESSSFVMDQHPTRPSPPSQSISVTLKLPGDHRLSYARSDTFLNYRFHRSSYHQFCSSSETAMLIRRRDRFSIWTKDKIEMENPMKSNRKKFQYLIELQSSNTCLEGSTEFTPDFLLTAMTNSKFDDDNDHTEQFGIETDQEKYFLPTNSSIIDDKQDQLETLTFDSIDEENEDSLDLSPIKSDTKNNYFFIDRIEEFSKEHLEQWQLPNSFQRTNSFDDLPTKIKSQLHLKHRRTSFRSMIGQRVRLKSDQRSFSSIDNHQNNNFYPAEESIECLSSNFQRRSNLLDMFETFEMNDEFSHSNLKSVHQHIREFLFEFNRNDRSERKKTHR